MASKLKKNLPPRLFVEWWYEVDSADAFVKIAKDRGYKLSLASVRARANRFRKSGVALPNYGMRPDWDELKELADKRNSELA